jgi:hypothetical protein
VSKGLKITYTGAPLNASGRFFVLNLRQPIKTSFTRLTNPIVDSWTFANADEYTAAVIAHPETKVISAFEAMKGFSVEHYAVDPAGVQNFYRVDAGAVSAERATSIWGSVNEGLTDVVDPGARAAMRSWSTIYIVGEGMPAAAVSIVEVHQKMEAMFPADNFFSQLADSPNTGILPPIRGINAHSSTHLLPIKDGSLGYQEAGNQVVVSADVTRRIRRR